MAIDQEEVGVSFADWLKALLEKRGLSQERAARMLDVSKNTIHRWCNGQAEPRRKELGKIWRVFGPVPDAVMRM